MAIHSGRRGFVTLLGDATMSPLASALQRSTARFGV